MKQNDVATALDRNFSSVNEADRNGEVANVVDAGYAIARSLGRIAKALEAIAGSIGRKA